VKVRKTQAEGKEMLFHVFFVVICGKLYIELQAVHFALID